VVRYLVTHWHRNNTCLYVSDLQLVIDIISRLDIEAELASVVLSPFRETTPES